MNFECQFCGIIGTIEYWDEWDSGLALLRGHMKYRHPIHSMATWVSRAVWAFRHPRKPLTTEQKRARIRAKLESGELPRAQDMMQLKERVLQ